jgi:hypothetical protein
MSNEGNRPSRQFMHLVGAYAQIHFRMNGLISSPNHPPAGSRYDRETKRETEDGSSRVKKGGIASRKAMSKKSYTLRHQVSYTPPRLCTDRLLAVAFPCSLEGIERKHRWTDSANLRGLSPQREKKIGWAPTRT